MTGHGLETLNATLQALPMGMVVTRKLLASREAKGVGSVHLPVPDDENLEVRATKVTALLSHIPGYDHGGLNE